MARTKVPTRPEMIHENPVLAPLLVSLLRESSSALVRQSQRGEDGNMPVGAASSRAMAGIIDTWADQIDAFHRPETEAAEPAELFREHGGNDEHADQRDDAGPVDF
jgi:hypothetical protein